jgi:hypothetical protein
MVSRLSFCGCQPRVCFISWLSAVNAAGSPAAGTAALAARIGVELHFDTLFVAFSGKSDGFDHEAGQVLHPAQECFKGRLNGGCGVVLLSNPIQRPWPPFATPACPETQPGFRKAKPLPADRRGPQARSSGRTI